MEKYSNLPNCSSEILQISLTHNLHEETKILQFKEDNISQLSNSFWSVIQTTTSQNWRLPRDMSEEIFAYMRGAQEIMCRIQYMNVIHRDATNYAVGVPLESNSWRSTSAHSTLLRKRRVVLEDLRSEWSNCLNFTIRAQHLVRVHMTLTSYLTARPFITLLLHQHYCYIRITSQLLYTI